MPLSDRGRVLAERAFGTTPLDVYVSVELGPVAWECPSNHGVLHLNDDVQMVEILDDQDRRVPDGEVGQVVITQLNCTAQPLIRYRLGDLAARLPSRCPCGRGLGLLSRVQGRTRHFIRVPDGRVLYGMGFGAILKTFPEVARWQAQQVAPTRLRVLVVPSRDWTPASAAAIARKLAEKLGDSMHYELVPWITSRWHRAENFKRLSLLSQPLPDLLHQLLNPGCNLLAQTLASSDDQHRVIPAIVPMISDQPA